MTFNGRLIVATPALVDPNFHRAVVLVLEHGDDGTVGVVLNRPSETGIAEALPGWDELAAVPPVVFVGGPVQPDAVVGLAVARVEGDGDGSLEPVLGRLAVVDLSRSPATVAVDVERVRLFAGYAGWGEGQLESEIADGAWWVLDAEPEDALSTEPGGLWRGVLQRQGGLFATIPDDPKLN